MSIFIAGFASLITSAQLDPIPAQVERVIDGDTIRVRFEGKSYTVRLIGVDTPETKHPTKEVEYFGREASAFTKAALEGKTVLLAKDRTGDTVDRYGRLLRYVLVDGDNFNARLIREGYAHDYSTRRPVDDRVRRGAVNRHHDAFRNGCRCGPDHRLHQQYVAHVERDGISALHGNDNLQLQDPYLQQRGIRLSHRADHQ